MKEQYDRFEVFPQDEVRLAIRTGIAQAQEQIDGKVKTPLYKRKITYLLSSVAVAFGLFIQLNILLRLQRVYRKYR